MKAVLRERHRYIGVVVMPPCSDRTLLSISMKNGVLRSIGETGVAAADPKLVWTSRSGTTAIIRCTHTGSDAVRTSLPFITKDHKGGRMHLMPVFTSGTILKCKRACEAAERRLGNSATD